MRIVIKTSADINAPAEDVWMPRFLLGRTFSDACDSVKFERMLLVGSSNG